MTGLPIVNLEEARFECIFGRGCDGICCREGRPPIYPDDLEKIEPNVEKFLPHLRPAARKVVEKQGFLSKRRKENVPMLRVVDGWCVFFNEGCVLHKVGVEDGDKYLYKPAVCALFPLDVDDHDRWYVRQSGKFKDKWSLFCLDPQASSMPASESLKDELALALKFEIAASERANAGAQ